MQTLWRSWFLFSSFSLVFSVVTACGSSGPGDGKGRYTAYDESTATTYVRTLPDGTTVRHTGQVTGTVEVGGRSWLQFEVGTQGSPEGAATVLGNLVGTESLELIGGSYSYPGGGALDIPVYVSYTLDDPLEVDISPPVGEAQSFSVTGSAVLGEAGADPMDVAISGSYTRVETGVEVETPVGVVRDCSRFEMQATVPVAEGTDLEVQAEVWYSPVLGAVKGRMITPLEGAGAGFAGNAGSFDLGDGWTSVQGMAVLGAGNGDTFRLDTYDAAGAFDADKDTHAKMLLEVRWVDEDRAKTSERPPVTEGFGTVIGYYPAMLASSPVSFFHPEENDAGTIHWIAFVDQAAKNEAQNGIAYHIQVGLNDTSDAVRVTARIIYKRYEGS